MNSQELLSSVITVMTNVPKATLKKYFTRHCAALNDKALSKTLPADWAQFKQAYADFCTSFASVVDEDETLQRVLVQLATVSGLLGKLNASDEFGLFAGCVLFVSEWSQALGARLFPTSPWYAFFAVWSPVLDSFKVEWAFHGPSRTTLMALEQDAGEDDEYMPYALVFPGPAPAVDLSALGWSDHYKTIPNQTIADTFNYVFGITGRPSSKQVFYFNPGDDEYAVLRKFERSWAIDKMAAAPEIVEFEDEPEEDTGKFTADMSKLRSLLCDAAIDPPTQQNSGDK